MYIYIHTSTQFTANLLNAEEEITYRNNFKANWQKDSYVC